MPCPVLPSPIIQLLIQHICLPQSCLLQVWPKDALEAVAYKFLKEMDLDDPTRVKLVELCQSVHRKVYRLEWLKSELAEWRCSDFGIKLLCLFFLQLKLAFWLPIISPA